MIPTHYKAKLPRQLSYPIGAEALTEGLTGAPHAELLSLSFWGKPVWPGSRFKQVEAQQWPYTILVVEYRPARQPGYGGARYMIESGWYDTKWEVTVYPVVRELRHHANCLLRERGLPLVVKWLSGSNRPGWLSRDQRIQFVFSPAEGTLSAQESSGV